MTFIQKFLPLESKALLGSSTVAFKSNAPLERWPHHWAPWRQTTLGHTSLCVMAEVPHGSDHINNKDGGGGWPRAAKTWENDGDQPTNPSPLEINGRGPSTTTPTWRHYHESRALPLNTRWVMSLYVRLEVHSFSRRRKMKYFILCQFSFVWIIFNILSLIHVVWDILWWGSSFENKMTRV
jgi:hypothetical protein